MEAWEKVFVEEDFINDQHNKMGCVICHGGDDTAQDMETAHVNIVTDPSEDNCSTCHREIRESTEHSFHITVSGMKAALIERGGNFDEDSILSTAFDNHCEDCHSSCGQCHVSIPTQAGGGLVSGHEFKAPKMQDNCVTCHGARVGNEYLGENEGAPKDVHRKKGMQCSSCHGEELHSSGADAENRYHTSEAPSCTDAGCHDDIYSTTDSNPQHEQHLDDLSCQVCHSVEYKSCYNCHTELVDGKPIYKTDPSAMVFKIGLNPIQSSERPYKYVVLRHVPTNPDIFAYYGDNLLPDFDALPTWKYATPHNIQLNTPQNASCDSCHGNAELFLTVEDLEPGEVEANQDVIVPEIPNPGY